MKEESGWRERLSRVWAYIALVLLLLLLAYIPIVKAILRSIPLLVLGGVLLLLILLGPLTRSPKDGKDR